MERFFCPFKITHVAAMGYYDSNDEPFIIFTEMVLNLPRTMSDNFYKRF